MVRICFAELHIRYSVYVPNINLIDDLISAPSLLLDQIFC